MSYVSNHHTRNFNSVAGKLSCVVLLSQHCLKFDSCSFQKRLFSWTSWIRNLDSTLDSVHSVLTEIAHANMYGDTKIIQHVMNKFAATRGPPPEKSLDAVEPFSHRPPERTCATYYLQKDERMSASGERRGWRPNRLTSVPAWNTSPRKALIKPVRIATQQHNLSQPFSSTSRNTKLLRRYDISKSAS